ncbi:ParA family protein [Desulfobacterales bacterium HSG2]|nr:ParA family protein [Desulfobacterales bacterium HSG2]
MPTDNRQLTTDSQHILTANELISLTGHQKAGDILKSFDKKDLLKMPGGKWGIPAQTVKAYFSERGVDYSFKVVAHINLKGGTGKTTSTISAAVRAMQYGFRTCILDMDPQGNASLAFDRIPEEDDPIFCDVWQNPAEMIMGSLRAIEENLHILPSSLENSLLDVQLMNPALQKHAVRGVCDELKKKGFDLVIIDCPPSLGTAVISTICAADVVVIPLCSDIFSMKGAKLTLSEISSICEAFHLEPPVTDILYTKFDKRVKTSVNALHQISSEYQEFLIPVPIRTSAEFSKAIEKKKTVFALKGKSSAKEDYDKYVRYLLKLDSNFKRGEK